MSLRFVFPNVLVKTVFSISVLHNVNIICFSCWLQDLANISVMFGKFVQRIWYNIYICKVLSPYLLCEPIIYWEREQIFINMNSDGLE